MQTLGWSHHSTLKDDRVTHGFHAQHADLLLHQLWKDKMRKTAVVGIHYVERHLHRVKAEAMLGRHFQHVQVDVRVLVAGKSDVTRLPCLLRFEHCFMRTALGKDAVGVVETNDLMVLD